MKKIFNWQTLLGIILVLMSTLGYLIHYFLFRDAHHIFIYLIGDIAFVFLEVLIVTMILHKLLVHREKQAILKKLNMVIGTFFIEAGTELLKKCSVFDPEGAKISEKLNVAVGWTDKEFMVIKREIKSYEYNLDYKKGDLNEMKDFLSEKRAFCLNLIENPNLLEHESFTDLLWAVFHLTDELLHRKDLGDLPDTDYKHIAGDMKRAYTLLISEWLSYMEHLKRDYPYLFSLAIRTNPFNPDASIEVT